MDTIVENKETIKDLKSLVNEGKLRFNLLKQDLTNEKHNSFTLSQQIETHEIDKVKHLESIDRALEMSQALHASKKELEVAHASLTKDLEHLENARKLLKDELNNLEEKHDQLRATQEKSIDLSSAPIVVENAKYFNDACATKSTSCEASILKENV